MSNRSNTPIVPQAMRLLDQLKYEIAQELGIQVPTGDYWGTIGGNMTRKLVALAEERSIV